jgi:hypothetical protein
MRPSTPTMGICEEWWLRPTWYLDGYPVLLQGDLEGGQGPKAVSVFCHQAQEVHEAFTLLTVGVGDWPTLQKQRGAVVLQCLFWPHCGQGPGDGQGEGQVFAQCLVWFHLKQASEGVHCCLAIWKLEEVASGQPWRTGPFTGLKPHLSYKYLKCHFHKISLGSLRATLHLFKFSLNIREGLGNKMRVENNYFILGRWVSCQVISYAWVRCLNSLI